MITATLISAGSIQPPASLDDRRLVGRFLERRTEGDFRALYRRHAPQLYRVIVRWVGTERADDVLQETWIRAVTGLPRFAWRSSLRTWLTGIAIRCCHEARRRRQAAEIQADGNSSEESADGLRLDLERALAALPSRRREILWLHDAEGFTHAEIGELLDIAEGTSKSQLARARATVRQMLQSAGAEGDSE